MLLKDSITNGANKWNMFARNPLSNHPKNMENCNLCHGDGKQTFATKHKFHAYLLFEKA